MAVAHKGSISMGLVGGCGNGRLAFTPADYLNTAMVNCYGITSQIGYSDLLKVNSLRSKVFAFGKYTKGSTRKRRRGSVASPVMIGAD